MIVPDAVEVDRGNSEIPEVLALLADALGDHEQAVVATADLAARIGWEVKSLGEALRRAGVPAGDTFSPAHQRIAAPCRGYRPE